MNGATRLPLRQLLLAGVCLLALSAAFQARGLSPDWLLSDPSIRGADYAGYFAPYAAFIQHELRAGRLPLWNPYILTGIPVIEALQPALVHPFTLLLVAIPFEHALTLLAVVRPALAGFGAFVLARVLGCALPAAALAGTLFMLSPFHLRFRFHSVSNVSALLPLLLAASELHLRGAAPRRCGAVWSLVGMLVVLGGHSQTSVHTISAAWLYHLLRAPTSGAAGQRWQRTARALRFLSACSALAGLGAAVAAWGHVEMVVAGYAMRYRSAMGGYRHLPVYHLFSFFVPGVPGILPFPFSTAYLGTVTLVLAAGGAVGGGPFPAWPWVVMGAGSLLAAYGAWPVAPVLNSLPLLGRADHSRLLMVVHLALAMLAARGLQNMGSRLNRRAMIGGAVLVALALGWLWVSGRFPGPGSPSGRPTTLLLPVLFLALACVVIAGAHVLRERRAWAWFAVTVVLADLCTALAPPRCREPAALPPPPGLLRLLDDPPGTARSLLPHHFLPANLNMVYGLPAVAGYESAVLPDRTAELLRRAGLSPLRDLGFFAPDAVRPGGLRLLSLLNVRHIGLPARIRDPALAAQLTEVGPPSARDSGKPALYDNPGALPRAFAVEQVRVAGTPEEVLALLEDPRVDLGRVVMLERPLPAGLAQPAPTGGPAPEARILDYRPGAVRIAVATSGGGYLVFSETFVPGWRAAVDGRRAPVLRADYALIGVPLPAGTHEVTLRYRPLRLVLGGAVMLVTAVGVVLGSVLPSRRTSIEPERAEQVRAVHGHAR